MLLPFPCCIYGNWSTETLKLFHAYEVSDWYNQNLNTCVLIPNYKLFFNYTPWSTNSKIYPQLYYEILYIKFQGREFSNLYIKDWCLHLFLWATLNFHASWFPQLRPARPPLSPFANLLLVFYHFSPILCIVVKFLDF